MIYKCHLFLCESCTKSGNGLFFSPTDLSAWRKELKKQFSDKFAADQVRVNGSKCLGQCEKGISCVIYPQQEWLLGLNIGENDRLMKFVDKYINE